MNRSILSTLYGVSNNDKLPLYLLNIIIYEVDIFREHIKIYYKKYRLFMADFIRQNVLVLL